MKAESRQIEELKIKKPVIVVVEDSLRYGQNHKRNLERHGATVIVLKALGNFEEELKKIQEDYKIDTVVTDGLHGNWRAVYEAAMKIGINSIWLISGNSDMIKTSNNFYQINAITKYDLDKNPTLYQRIIKKSTA